MSLTKAYSPVPVEGWQEQVPRLDLSCPAVSQLRYFLQRFCSVIVPNEIARIVGPSGKHFTSIEARSFSGSMTTTSGFTSVVFRLLPLPEKVTPKWAREMSVG